MAVLRLENHLGCEISQVDEHFARLCKAGDELGSRRHAEARHVSKALRRRFSGLEDQVDAVPTPVDQCSQCSKARGESGHMKRMRRWDD